MLVCDSLGVGEAPDAPGYGDQGADTVGHAAAAAGGLRLPTLRSWGFGRLTEIAGVPATDPAGAVVARMADGGVELALGLVRDPQFGPLVMVAAGGVLVEVLRDRRFLLPPVDARTARAALDRLAVRPLLHGAGPNARPAHLDAVAGAVVALSGLAVDLGDCWPPSTSTRCWPARTAAWPLTPWWCAPA